MKDNQKSWLLALGSLGMVYGDIGTSPLYAIRVILQDLPVTPLDILGVLSLIIWSLIIIISIKYLVVFFRLDNEGEGGILALFALIQGTHTRYHAFFYVLAIFGTGLLLGDGMLMPATSVLSAVRGLKIIAPEVGAYIKVLSCLILILLFAFQWKGSAKISVAFGPILCCWFFSIALLGLVSLVKNPMVLKAFNPYCAFQFLYLNGSHGFFILGGIFLVVTGGEALYANMGNFGKMPIRKSWFTVVLPCLLLNYLGQGANLLLHPDAIADPFYMLSPDWCFIPLLIIATLASIIASQTMISAIFSLTKQARLLGLCPRIPIIQTSSEHMGQIYVPQMNYLLLMGTLVFIYSFEDSYALANAYGFAVNVYMLLMTIMATYAAFRVWRWTWAQTCVVFSLFISIDAAFLAANCHKILTGGAIPIIFAVFVAVIMHTWHKGIKYLGRNFYKQKDEISKVIANLKYESLNQLKGLTGIFITDIYDQSGSSFLRFLKLNLAIPEHILIVNYVVENKPYVSKKRIELRQWDKGIVQLTLHYGFMQAVSIPKALKKLNEKQLLPFAINVEHATYFVEIPNIMASKRKRTLTFYWQERIFAFLVRNYSANLNIDFYNIPYNRTVAIGTYCVI